MSPFIGLDLYILNEGMRKVGYYKSEYISAGLSNDGLSVGPDEGNLTLPAEVYHSSERKLTFLIIRSGVRGSFKTFGTELTNWVTAQGFSNVVVLTSTLSPVLRERDTNRL
jgi:predicted ATP-grasp superfamily ATP-dependent carboligase